MSTRHVNSFDDKINTLNDSAVALIHANKDGGLE